MSGLDPGDGVLGQRPLIDHLLNFGLFTLKVLLRYLSRDNEEAVGYKGPTWNGDIHLKFIGIWLVIEPMHVG